MIVTDASQINRCEHKSCAPAFDSAAAEGLDAYEVRKRWPRFNGRCPECGEQMIYYASMEHYVAGDW
jgi:predicted RNA-binding Zn-ribbon protein involved in translation (DUF1610 family)